LNCNHTEFKDHMLVH